MGMYTDQYGQILPGSTAAPAIAMPATQTAPANIPTAGIASAPVDQQTMKNKAMASLLRQQASGSDPGTQVVNGWAVPQSGLGGIEKVAQGLASNYLQNKVG